MFGKRKSSWTISQFPRRIIGSHVLSTGELKVPKSPYRVHIVRGLAERRRKFGSISRVSASPPLAPPLVGDKEKRADKRGWPTPYHTLTRTNRLIDYRRHAGNNDTAASRADRVYPWSIIPSTEFTHVTVFRGARGRVASHLRVSRRWIDRGGTEGADISYDTRDILRSRYARV